MKWLEKVLALLKRKCWYILLLICSSIYVFHYRYEINQIKDFNAQNLIFILWLALLLFPLFSEMEFLGVKLKKEVEKAKSEVKEGLSELRFQIMDLKISNSNTNSIYVSGPLPSKEQMEEILKKTNTTPNRTDKDHQEDGAKTKKVEFAISEQSIYLFKVKLSLEKALSAICEKTGYEGNKQYKLFLCHLNRIGILSSDETKMIIQVQDIANRGIHGEILSMDYIGFVEKAFPQVLKQIEDANAALNYCICPSCKYTGYATFENVCPRCGFVHDHG